MKINNFLRYLAIIFFAFSSGNLLSMCINNSQIADQIYELQCLATVIPILNYKALLFKPNYQHEPIDNSDAYTILYTIWPSKPDTIYILLGKDMCGEHENQWENFGGNQDSAIKNTLDNNNTVINNRKNLITTFVHLDYKTIENLTHNFYINFNKTTHKSCKEKKCFSFC